MAEIQPPTYFLTPTTSSPRASTALPLSTPPTHTPPTLYLTTRHNPTTHTPLLNINCSNTASSGTFHKASYFSDIASGTEGVEVRWRHDDAGESENGSQGGDLGHDGDEAEGVYWVVRRVVLDKGKYDLVGLRGGEVDVDGVGEDWVTVKVVGL